MDTGLQEYRSSQVLMKDFEVVAWLSSSGENWLLLSQQGRSTFDVPDHAVKVQINDANDCATCECVKIKSKR